MSWEFTKQNMVYRELSNKEYDCHKLPWDSFHKDRVGTILKYRK